jgi:hypothetical protein
MYRRPATLPGVLACMTPEDLIVDTIIVRRQPRAGNPRRRRRRLTIGRLVDLLAAIPDLRAILGPDAVLVVRPGQPVYVERPH